MATPADTTPTGTSAAAAGQNNGGSGTADKGPYSTQGAPDPNAPTGNPNGNMPAPPPATPTATAS